MQLYCYLCPTCGETFESPHRSPTAICSNEHMARRDFRAEHAGVAVAELARQREQSLDGESGRKAQRDVFLPTVAEYGEKYVRNWNDSHGPKSGNKAPLYPEVPKRSF